MLRRLLARKRKPAPLAWGEVPGVRWPDPEPASPPGSMIVKPEREQCPRCGSCPTCGR